MLNILRRKEIREGIIGCEVTSMTLVSFVSCIRPSWILMIGLLFQPVISIRCGRCNSLTDSACAGGTGIELQDCPGGHCLIYWSTFEDVPVPSPDEVVVRDCSEMSINTCTTTGLRNPHVISCFRSCDQDGCNLDPVK